MVFLFIIDKVDREDPEAVQAIFSVPDFIGFVCKNIGEFIFSF